MGGTGMTSQDDLILAHLKAGESITPLEALEKFGCFRLAARISTLRQRGYAIQAKLVELGNGKIVGEYRLV
jgi:hypothetical protein